MEMKSIIKKIKKKFLSSGNDTQNPENNSDNSKTIRKKYNILLLTNRDSDNVGDQVIEACDIALISTVMKNLNINKNCYEIKSRAASMISQQYLSSKDPKLLESAKKSIKECDLIIFGGAPVFNYLYQSFYERTAITLEIAQEYNKPVIFSAIGIESYDEDNAKCQRLKKTLNFDCVKQITTRDDFDALKKYINNDKTVIAKVSDPAVFTSEIFKNNIAKKTKNKKVGIFVLRANGFVDNNFDFTREDAALFWKGLVSELKNKGYDYDLVTSGHFSDEAFIDLLIRKYNIDPNKCVFNINAPDKLIKKISSYDAVVSCRLHPSIISFALNVPSIGIVWNTKVKGFYDSIGYGERIINVDGISPEKVVESIEQALNKGIEKDEKYVTSIYTSLFNGIKRVLCPEDNVKPYTYAELLEKIPAYKGTTSSEQEGKLRRKFRRTYNAYNNCFEKNIRYQKTIDELKAENEQLKQKFNQ